MSTHMNRCEPFARSAVRHSTRPRESSSQLQLQRPGPSSNLPHPHPLPHPARRAPPARSRPRPSRTPPLTRQTPPESGRAVGPWTPCDRGSPSQPPLRTQAPRSGSAGPDPTPGCPAAARPCSMPGSGWRWGTSHPARRTVRWRGPGGPRSPTASGGGLRGHCPMGLRPAEGGWGELY